MVPAREEFDETSAVSKTLVLVFGVRLSKEWSSWASPAGGGPPEQWVFLYFNWNRYRAVAKMMECYGLEGNSKHLTINPSRGSRVRILVCLGFKLNLWDHWKPNKYHLPVSGSTSVPWISCLGLGRRLNNVSLIIDNALTMEHSKGSISATTTGRLDGA